MQTASLIGDGKTGTLSISLMLDALGTTDRTDRKDFAMILLLPDKE
ncbi:MAG TPA: hypothetical protein VJ746_12505 [Nitrospira sp.]|nr:hypothetical protein [Nitrospira sp.]